MTGVKISALPAASAANDTDQLEVNQSGTSRRLTVAQIVALSGGGDGDGGGTVSAWVPIGFRGRGFPGSKGVPDPETNPANSSFQDETSWMSPSWDAVSAIRLVYPCHDIWDNGPQDRPTTVTGASSVFLMTPAFSQQTTALASAGATSISVNSSVGVKVGAVVTAQSPNGACITAGTYVTATHPVSTTVSANIVADLSAPIAIDLPSAAVVSFTGSVVPATFGGRRQMLIEPRRGVVKSDPIPLYLAPNTAFYVKTHGNITGGTSWTLQEGGSTGSSYIAGDAMLRGTSLANHTLSAVRMTSTPGSGHWCPVWIEGLLANPATAVVAIAGDSNAHGIGDTADSFGRTGYFQRSLGNNIPWLALTRGGQNASYYGSKDDTMRSLTAGLVETGVTDFIVQWCRNDLLGVGRTAALVLADIQTMARMLTTLGIRAWASTSPPFTTGTWTSAAGQTIPNPTREAERTTYNTTIRSSFATYGFVGVIDVASITDDPANPGKWRSDGGVARTTDGTHLNATSVNEVVASGIVTPAMFAAPVLSLSRRG